MDLTATLITGIYWGLIINAIWISGYFILLFIHFWKIYNDPLYPGRYAMIEKDIKKKGVGKLVREESQLDLIALRFRGIVTYLKTLFRVVKMRIFKKRGI